MVLKYKTCVTEIDKKITKNKAKKNLKNFQKIYWQKVSHVLK